MDDHSLTFVYRPFVIEMIVESVNIGERETILWRGKEVETGIFKKPVSGSICLGKEDVEGDQVVDRRYHGGSSKACYLYSVDWYPFWKELYPDLDWTNGMFGENISLKGMDESTMHIGDVFAIGTAKVRVLSARQPCFKLGVKFGTQSVIKQFIQQPYPGVYVGILKEGKVQRGDELRFIERPAGSISLIKTYRELYKVDRDPKFVQEIFENEFVPEEEKNSLRRKIGVK